MPDQVLSHFSAQNQAVANDIQARVAAHQAAIAASPPAGALNLIADGDSWFDYPLGGDFPGDRTDVIAQLGRLGSPRPTILNLAHYGYTTTQELGLAKRKAVVEALQDARNGKFDAILMSGGGNDIAGDSLPLWLNPAHSVGWDTTKALALDRLGARLACVRWAYEQLVSIRDAYLPGAPVVIHSYDFAQPNGVGVCWLGPWLKPGLDFMGWTDPAGQVAIVRALLEQFDQEQARFAAATANVIKVPTQGILKPNEWANELHPDPHGFALIAMKFREALATRFPGRI